MRFPALILLLASATAAPGAINWLLLNTEAGNPERGEIETVPETGGSRTVLLDVDPTPFTVIENYKGFGTDGSNYFFWNSDGTGASAGTVQRTDLDGSGKINFLDLSTTLPNFIEFKGFGADNSYFYLLNTEAADTASGLGDIIRFDQDGGNQTTLGNIVTSGMFGSGGAANLKGLAADNGTLYLLNVTGGEGFRGRVYRVDDLANGIRSDAIDLSPTTIPSAEMNGFYGFAIPEPGLALVPLGFMLLAGFASRRRRS